MGGPAAGWSLPLWAAGGKHSRRGGLAGAGDTWWPWHGRSSWAEACSRQDRGCALTPTVLGVRSSARSLPIYRMEELGLHPADRQGVLWTASGHV